MAESSHLACAHAPFEKVLFETFFILKGEFKKQTLKLLDTTFSAFMQPDQPEQT